MADPIEKFLTKVSTKERLILSTMIELILAGKKAGPDIKKLTGSDYVFRVRKGKYRIVYRVTPTEIKILSIGKRDDNTYNKF